MNLSANQYFALIVPICALLQGLALIGCWSAIRQHRYLLWIAASYIISALPLAAHSLMATSQLADWSLLAGVLYLTGLWAAARGMAGKYGCTAHPRIALCIGAVILALLYYFSQIDDQLWVRMLCLNIGIFLMLALPVRGILRTPRSAIFLERLLRASFFLLVAYALLRTVAVYVYMPYEITIELTQSGYWLLMLAVSLLISMWFTFVLLACVMREIFQTLKIERNQDPLTRLLNRRAFFEQADRQLLMSTHQQWALIACDIDHFKKVNDTWGHAAGDQVLAMVAQIFTGQVREYDLVARFGGEEFVILLKCNDRLDAKNAVERMRLHIAGTTYPAISGHLTASFGMTMVQSGQSILETIEDADAMLYQAKERGRNQVVFDKKE